MGLAPKEGRGRNFLSSPREVQVQKETSPKERVGKKLSQGTPPQEGGGGGVLGGWGFLFGWTEKKGDKEKKSKRSKTALPKALEELFCRH